MENIARRNIKFRENYIYLSRMQFEGWNIGESRNSKIGSKVVRKNERKEEIGTIIEIKDNRVRVEWQVVYAACTVLRKTWYSIANLEFI